MDRDPARRASRKPEPGREAALREELERLAAQRARLEAELATSEGRLPVRPPVDTAPVHPRTGSPMEQRRRTGRAIRVALLALGLGAGLYYIVQLREGGPGARAAAAIEAAAEAEAEAADAAAAAAEAAAEAAAARAAARAEADARARANRVRPDGPRSGTTVQQP